MKSLFGIGFVIFKIVAAASLATSMSVFLVGLRLAMLSKQRAVSSRTQSIEGTSTSIAA